jgi:putative flippase GtrA
MICKFLAVGVANTVFGLAAIYSSMYFLGLSPLLSNFIGYFLGFILGYVLNRKWTFDSKSARNNRFSMYLAVIFISYLGNLISVQFSVKYLLANPYLAQIGGMVIYTAMSFTGCRKFVFTDEG